MMKTIRAYIEDMLLYKESLGYSRQSYEYNLERFCRFTESKHLDVSELREEVVLSWCSRWENESPTGARRRIQSVRELLKYLSAIGIDCYVIPSIFLPRPKMRTPYIFTDKEMLSIFKECDRLPVNQYSPNRHLILPVLLRLIYFCGLRPNEGRELQSCDIDFDKGVLLIRKNKSHKERYVAISDDVLQMCANYRSIAINVYSDQKYFFPSPNGMPYDRHWLARQFRMIWRRVRVNGSEVPAVVYDLRHRYATTMMMKWLDEGADLNAKLPYLSSYMGHTHLSDTAYYIHLLPENLIRSSAIDWSHFSDLIPEVTEDE
jgi:integrase